jgi:hypothetical protein
VNRVDNLFEDLYPTRPFKVALPGVQNNQDHYQVRIWLLAEGWAEYRDWMISPHLYYQHVYEVWFSDLAKATYFKLSFTL